MTDRRERILDAALDAFVTKGYGAATIEEVRRRSGASVGSIYHRFGGKEGLAAALYIDCLRGYQRGALDALRRHRDAESGVKALVHHHLRWVRDNPERAIFLLDRRECEVAVVGEGEIEALNSETFAAVGEWLRPHERAGRIRRMPRELLYAVVIGPAQEYARHWLRDRMHIPLAEAERVLARAAWDAVRNDDRGGTR
jgi:AcrR family transcriptional regulator